MRLGEMLRFGVLYIICRETCMRLNNSEIHIAANVKVAGTTNSQHGRASTMHLLSPTEHNVEVDKPSLAVRNRASSVPLA